MYHYRQSMYICANNSTLYIYGMLTFLYLVSLKFVTVFLIVAAHTPLTTVVRYLLCYWRKLKPLLLWGYVR